MGSLMLSGALKYVPNGALFGVFLFMGLSSIAGNQLFDRIFLWSQFDPSTYPRLPYVTRTTTRKLHLFTFIQFMCLAILYGLKAVKQTAMVFPFFIALLVFVRKGLVKYFSKEELDALDNDEDLLPDPEPEKKEAAKASSDQDPKEKETEASVEICIEGSEETVEGTDVTEETEETEETKETQEIVPLEMS